MYKSVDHFKQRRPELTSNTMQTSLKRNRENHNSNSPNQPPAKRQKVNPKQTPKNVIKYWTNKQLLGKHVVIRHGSDYQIGKFQKVSTTHALIHCLQAFIYPIIDQKFKYKSLLKPNGEDNVFRYTINGGEYNYFDIPIHYYSEETLQSNKEFKVKYINRLVKSYKKRYDNLKNFVKYRILDPAYMKHFLSNTRMPDNIKNNKAKICNWLLNTKKFGESDFKGLYDKLSEYYDIKEKRYYNFYVKEFVYILYKWNMELRDFWKTKYNEIKQKCGEISCVGKHGLIIPYNATVCERGFSEQNRHITKARPNIGTALLRDLLMICLEGPKFGSAKFFNIMERALIVWKLPEPAK